MQERLLNPLEYKRVLKQATVIGERETGLCKIKCKKLNNITPSEYLKYVYLLVAVFMLIFLILFVGVGDTQYPEDFKCYMGDVCPILLLMVLADFFGCFNYLLEANDKLAVWEHHEEVHYCKSPGIAFNFLKHDFIHFLCIEPIDSVFHLFHLIVMTVMLRLQWVIPVIIYLCLFLVVDIVELSSTRRNVLNMKYVLENEDLLISGNPFIFPEGDLELYTWIMETFVKLHTISKLWRISQLGVCVIFISLFSFPS